MRWQAALIAVSVYGLCGCESLQSGLKKAVIMDYDQVMNFRSYEFEETIQWTPSLTQSGITGNAQDVKGYWITYVICNIRNTGSEATQFNFDLSKFYVEFEGKKFNYRPLDPYTFTSRPHALVANAQATANVNHLVVKEVTLNHANDQYPPQMVQEDNPSRFAIYITKSEPGVVDISGRIPLRYEGHPNILNPRNQEPLLRDSNQPAHKNEIYHQCRPQLN